MADVFNAEKRSDVMSRIRGRGNATTEMAVVAIFREANITGWRRHVEMRPRPAAEDRIRATKNGRMRVRPDFVFRSARLVLFIDGCFWHSCPLHATKPRQNSTFWSLKLHTNVQRDAAHTRALQLAGWAVLRIWEHELRQPAQVRIRIENFLRMG